MPGYSQPRLRATVSAGDPACYHLRQPAIAAPHPRRAGGYMFAPPCLAARRLTIIARSAVVSAFIRVIRGSVFAAESVGFRRRRLGETAMISDQ